MTFEETDVEAPSGAERPSSDTEQPRYRDRDGGRTSRRKTSIHAYVGANGGGKSFAMVHDTLPSLDAGRTVLSTVRLLDSATGEPHPSYVRLTEWTQLLEAEHCDVLFDEVVGIAGARESGGMPVQVANLLVQLRRRDICLRWTAPNWARADKIIREVTQAVTLCKGGFSTRATAGDLWPVSRRFSLRTYETIDFEEWSLDKSKKLSLVKKAALWGPKSRAFASYDTLGQVERVGEVLDSGRCAHCGGRRAIPLCRCER
ncbi:MAG TPA: hypothetical protein VNT53_05110 [Pseudolysinimonas sp.]|nr:hypothetical protein [Pseudolysinimonas sp.]